MIADTAIGGGFVLRHDSATRSSCEFVAKELLKTKERKAALIGMLVAPIGAASAVMVAGMAVGIKITRFGNELGKKAAQRKSDEGKMNQAVLGGVVALCGIMTTIATPITVVKNNLVFKKNVQNKLAQELALEKVGTEVSSSFKKPISLVGFSRDTIECGAQKIAQEGFVYTVRGTEDCRHDKVRQYEIKAQAL